MITFDLHLRTNFFSGLDRFEGIASLNGRVSYLPSGGVGVMRHHLFRFGYGHFLHFWIQTKYSIWLEFLFLETYMSGVKSRHLFLLSI